MVLMALLSVVLPGFGFFFSPETFLFSFFFQPLSILFKGNNCYFSFLTLHYSVHGIYAQYIKMPVLCTHICMCA